MSGTTYAVVMVSGFEMARRGTRGTPGTHVRTVRGFSTVGAAQSAAVEWEQERAGNLANVTPEDDAGMIAHLEGRTA
jgi:hypothetical protein